MGGAAAAAAAVRRSSVIFSTCLKCSGGSLGFVGSWHFSCSQ